MAGIYLDGQGGVYLGSIGLLGMVFAVSSVVFGLMDLAKKCALPVSEDWVILGGIMVAIVGIVVLMGFKEMPGRFAGSTKYGTIRMASLYCNL